MPASKQGTATDKVWTKEEQAAIQESARERKKQAKLTPEKEREAGEQEIQAKIAEMPEPDHTMAARIHALVSDAAPELIPRRMPRMARPSASSSPNRSSRSGTRRSASSRRQRSTTAISFRSPSR